MLRSVPNLLLRRWRSCIFWPNDLPCFRPRTFGPSPTIAERFTMMIVPSFWTQFTWIAAEEPKRAHLSFVLNHCRELRRLELIKQLAESPNIEVAVMASAGRIRLITSAATAALLFPAACSPVPPTNGSPLPTSEYTSGASVPYAAINTKRQVYFPEARTRGTFEISGGCVVYRRAGDNRLYTPVFPAGSQVVREGSAYSLLINGKRYSLGREVIMGGGEVTLPDYSEVSLSRMPPASCPSPIWVVGEIEDR